MGKEPIKVSDPSQGIMKIKIDTPAWSFIKYNDDGTVDYRSPIPCPFNYGSIVGTKSEDGEAKDAVLLGEKREKGESLDCNCVGIVRFVDGGEDDNKYIFSENYPTKKEKVLIYLFFRLFAFLKMLKNLKDGKIGTRIIGIKYTDPHA